MSCLALAALLIWFDFVVVQFCVAVFELSGVADFCVGWLGSGSVALLALCCDLWLSLSSLLGASLTLVAADVLQLILVWRRGQRTTARSEERWIAVNTWP